VLCLAVAPMLVLALNLPDLLVALVCLAAASWAIWISVLRRPVFLLATVPVIALALAGLGYVAYDHRVELGASVLALALFGLAARTAVRLADAPLARRVPAARHGVLVVNPRSGDGKAGRVGLAERAAGRGLEVVVLRPGDDLRAVVEAAVDAGADVVGMAGGDGSQALVATVAAERGVALVCVPSGTRNHFALDLGLDRTDPVAALDAFTDAVERTVDLATVNGRVFVNNASLGLYATVVQSAAYRDAKLRTWRRMLPDALAAGTLSFAGRPQEGATLVLVSNNPYELRHPRVAGTRPRLDTGTLGIVAAGVRAADDVARLVTLSAIGQQERMRGLRAWSAATFEVDAPGPVPVGLDGEALTMTPPLVFASRPGALRVRLPARAPGVSPAGAAVTLSRRDLSRLFRIALGR
jgi:diacylglycerol kinase family enzyme